MKKTWSIIISVMVFLCSTIIPANAISTEKFSSSLLEKLVTLDDTQKIEVYVSIDWSYPNTQAVYEATDKATDIDRHNFKNTDEVRAYYKLWRAINKENKKVSALSVMEKMGVTFNDVTEEQEWNEENIDTLGVPSRYCLTREQINHLVDVEEVVFVDVYNPNYEEIIKPIDNTMAHEDKISSELIDMIDSNETTDRYEVWITVNLKLTDRIELRKTACEICGLENNSIDNIEDINLFLKTYRTLVAKDKKDAIESLLKKMNVDETNILAKEWDYSLGWPNKFVFTKDELISIISLNLEEIVGIECYKGQDIPEENIPIQEPSENISLIGDLNNDGFVTVWDVTCLQRLVASYYDEVCSIENADVNGDGKITISDATLLQRYIAGFDVVLGKQFS